MTTGKPARPLRECGGITIYFSSFDVKGAALNPAISEEMVMHEHDLKLLIAQLLQDAERIQQIEPNAGTAARIESARNALQTKLKIEAAYVQGGEVTQVSA